MGDQSAPWRARVAAAVVDASPDWSAVWASRFLGAIARVPLPPAMGRAAVAMYARYFGVKLQDVDPLRLEEGFPNFNAFFSRPLRRGARSIDLSAATVVSPCDGRLSQAGPIDGERPIVAKGHAFSLEDLCADEALARSFVGGTSATIYLHPRDYHRVHSPCDALARRVTLVPGRLLPVTTASVSRNPNVFAVNERMIHVLETGHGTIAVVMIAAFGVGHMTCSYQRFSPHPRELQVADCEPPARLRKGDELGVFHLGSTVIVLAPSGVELCVEPDGGPVMLGQTLMREAQGAQGVRR